MSSIVDAPLEDIEANMVEEEVKVEGGFYQISHHFNLNSYSLKKLLIEGQFLLPRFLR